MEDGPPTTIVYQLNQQQKTLRQLFAQKYIEQLQAGKIIINLDESAISSSHTTIAKSWSSSEQLPGRCYEKPVGNLTLFFAACSDGSLFWIFMEGNNNRWTMIQVIVELAELLDREIPGWRLTHVLVHDICPGFASQECKRVVQHLSIPTLLTSPPRSSHSWWRSAFST